MAFVRKHLHLPSPKRITKFMKIFNMVYQIIIIFKILHFLTSCLTQFAKFFLLFKSSKSSPT